MIINWYGEGCFKIQSGGTVILVDPFESETGLTPPRFKADITIKTSAQFPLSYETLDQSLVSGPGEYEIKGVEISGRSIFSDSKNLESAYLVKAEDLKLGFLGHLSETPPASILEDFGEIDILFIPAGGSPFINQEKAAKLIKQINPKIVVASFFKIPGLKSKVGDYKDFLKELDQKTEPQEKLTIKKKELPARTEVVVLKI